MEFEEYSSWLKTQHRDLAVLIAARAAGRVFPIVTHLEEPSIDRDKTVLSVARAILIAATAPKMEGLHTKLAAVALSNITKPPRSLASNFPGSGATFDNHVFPVAHNLTTHHAIASARVAAVSATAKEETDDAITSVGLSIHGARLIEGEIPTRDAAFADKELPLRTLFEAPLWHEPKEPEWMVSALMPHINLLDRGPEWAFWRDWYRGLLIGEPLDWELQYRVATQIDESIWDDGPTAVAKEIERMRIAYDVEQRASKLAEDVGTFVQSSRGIGDNNPPSAIEDNRDSSDAVTIIWASVEDLKEQAQSEKPDKSQVFKAISGLASVMKACGLYAAKLADLGIKSAVIAAGTAGGAASVAWITQRADKIVELIEAVQKWLPFLS